MRFWGIKLWSGGLLLLLLAGGVFLILRNERVESRAAYSSEVSGSVQKVVVGADSNAVVRLSKAGAATSGSYEAVQPFELTFHSVSWPFLSNGEPSVEGALPEFHGAVIGDVTGDGRDDLISVGLIKQELGGPTPSPYKLYVYPQLPDGTLADPERYPLDPTDTFVGLFLADMNNDGVEDVVITHMQGIWLGLSGPGEALQVVRLSSTVADKKETHVAAVTLDLDGDGNQDVISRLQVSYYGQDDRSVDRRSRFRIIYGDGRGGALRSEDFGVYGLLIDAGTSSEAYEKEDATSLVVNDLNNDGYADLALASRRSDVLITPKTRPFISIYLNDRLGRFRDSQHIPVNHLNDESFPIVDILATGDFNGDGRNDLVGTYGSPQATLWTFLQTTSGGFNAFPDYGKQTHHLPEALVGVDLDTDGRDDVVVGHAISLTAGHPYSLTIGHYLQKGGSLLDEVKTGLPIEAYALGGLSQTGVAAGDLNSDGCTDLAVAGEAHGLMVLHGSNCIRAVAGGVLKPRSRPNPSASPSRPASRPSTRPIVRDPRLSPHRLNRGP